MPDWVQFQARHVLNPAVNGDYRTWTRSDWNTFLRSRIGDFGTKGINSIIIAPPENILQDFDSLNDHVQYSKPDFYWSNSRYPIVVMTLNRTTGDYDVRRLGEMYFLALIHNDPNRPVHFHAQGPNRVDRGNTNMSFQGYEYIN